MEPDYLHILQQEMGMSVDAQTLQNPTEDFMITLITEYLKKFYFDGYEISKVKIFLFMFILFTTLFN